VVEISDTHTHILGEGRKETWEGEENFPNYVIFVAHMFIKERNKAAHLRTSFGPTIFLSTKLH
jgi:hypothetical protein